tara:strand:- start:9096 stop:9641 length:546 start_codon:yes stop_codon:yes gene_type:complete
MDNIGDFAEQLVLGEVNDVQSGKTLHPSQSVQEGLAPAGKDIQRIEVPDSFMQEVLGEQYVSQNPVIEEAAEIPELVWTDPDGNDPDPEPQSLTEETAKQLVPLLEEVKGLLKEMSMAMTGTGNLGVNMAGPQKDSDSWESMEKRYGYKPSKKSKVPGDTTKKAVLKASIRNKLSKRNETY